MSIQYSRSKCDVKTISANKIKTLSSTLRLVTKQRTCKETWTLFLRIQIVDSSKNRLTRLPWRRSQWCQKCRSTHYLIKWFMTGLMPTSKKHVLSLTLSSSLRTLTHINLKLKSDVHRCHNFSWNLVSLVQSPRNKSNWCLLIFGRALAVITRVRAKYRWVIARIYFEPFKTSTIKISWTLIESRQLISTLWALVAKLKTVFFSHLKKSSISLESTSTCIQTAKTN